MGMRSEWATTRRRSCPSTTSNRCRRRVRATSAGQVVLDTTRALYVWEWPIYPQYYIPWTM